MNSKFFVSGRDFFLANQCERAKKYNSSVIYPSPKQLLGAIAKVRRSPANRTKLVSLVTPTQPPKRTKVPTSGFNSQTNVYTKHYLKPEVRFFRKPPPSQTNFVRFIGLLRTLRWSLSKNVNHCTVLRWSLSINVNHCTVHPKYCFTFCIVDSLVP